MPVGVLDSFQNPHEVVHAAADLADLAPEHRFNLLVLGARGVRGSGHAGLDQREPSGPRTRSLKNQVAASMRTYSGAVPSSSAALSRGQNHSAGLGLGEPAYRGAPVSSRHAALQNQRLVSAGGQQRREDLHVGDAAGEHEAVSAAAQGRRDVIDDSRVARVVGHQGSVHGGEGTRRRQVNIIAAEP